MARKKSARSQLYRTARDLGNLEAAEKRARVIWKALRAAQGVRQDQRLDTKVPSFNRIEQIGSPNLEFPVSSFITHGVDVMTNIPVSTYLGR